MAIKKLKINYKPQK